MAQRKKATIDGVELTSSAWVSVPTDSIAKIYGQEVAKLDSDLRKLFEATAKVKAAIEAKINAQVPVGRDYQLLFGYRGGIAVAKADKRTSGTKGAASDVADILKRLA
jgi:predicted sugar kinase